MKWHLVRLFAVSLFGTAVILYAALAGLGLYWSDRGVFRQHPSSYRDSPEFLKLTTENGNRITGLYLSNPSAKFTLLVSHGNGEDLGNARQWYESLRRAGFSVFAYDYEGYGTSEGKPSEEHTYQDESAAYSYLVTRLKAPSNRVIGFGKSFGSGPAVYIAAREPVAGLILQSSFASIFRVLTPIPLPFDKFPNYKTIRQVHCPVLIIHGTDDSAIDFQQAKELYELANEPKSHLWVTGANHNNVESVAGESYNKAVAAFTASLP